MSHKTLALVINISSLFIWW